MQTKPFSPELLHTGILQGFIRKKKKHTHTFGPLLRQIEKIANHLEMTSRCGIFPDELFS